MKRFILISFLSVACAVFLYAIWTKTSELNDLRARERAFLAGEAQPQTAVEPPSALPTTSSENAVTNSAELLQLRAEVHRLELRKKELMSARAENERLKVEFASVSTNSSPGLPPDYIRASRAQDRGFTTPQATLETFLWAGRNRNLDMLLKCFTPERSAKIAPDGGPQHFYDEASHIPGFRIVHTAIPEPDFLIADVEIFPGVPHPMEATFKLINGEWKLDSL